MTGAAWNTCNRVLDERWREQWQAHRDRVEFIQSASSVSAQAFSSALAASAHPHRIHTSRRASSPVKLQSRSNSYAAKARQKQIDRDNLMLIKKIIALDNAKATTTAKKKRTTRTPTLATARNYEKTTIVVPGPAHSDHECLHPLAEVPHSASSHVLYARGSATMKNNFAEYNAPTMMHSSNVTSAAARVRSRVQSKILNENKKILRRILTARTTVDRSALQQHEEKHSKLRSNMSRHNSTSKLQQQDQPRAMRTSRSQRSFRRDGDTEFFHAATNFAGSGIRVDPTSHLTQQRRPRSASHASARTRTPSACPLPLHTSRRSVSNESLVSRIRNMTIESHYE